MTEDRLIVLKRTLLDLCDLLNDEYKIEKVIAYAEDLL